MEKGERIEGGKEVELKTPIGKLQARQRKSLSNTCQEPCVFHRLPCPLPSSSALFRPTDSTNSCSVPFPPYSTSSNLSPSLFLLVPSRPVPSHFPPDPSRPVSASHFSLSLPAPCDTHPYSNHARLTPSQHIPFYIVSIYSIPFLGPRRRVHGERISVPVI